MIWTTSSATLVVVDPSATQSVVAATRDAVARDAPLDEILAALTSEGLGGAPDFLCAAWDDDGVRVLVRGRLTARMTASSGTDAELSAGRSRTWRDDVLPDVVSILVDTDDHRFEWFAAHAPATKPAPSASDAATADGPALSPPPAGKSADDGEVATSDDGIDEADASIAPPPADATLAGDDLAALVPEAEPDDTDEGSPAPDDRQTPQPPAQSDDDFDFSNLLDSTKFRDVESAAVRDSDDEDSDVARSGADENPDHTPPTAPPSVAPSPSPPPVEAVSAPPAPDDRSGLIAGVPQSGDGAAHSPASSGSDVPHDGLVDDGHTISLDELRRITAAEQATSPEPRGSQVRARRCPKGHLNPPAAASCRVCGVDIGESSVETVPRPTIVRLRFDSGAVVEVDRPQLIGRRPTTEGLPAGAELPGLVTVPSPDGDLSRVHAAVSVEGWDVLVEDCNSTNGTEVQLPGQDPVRLREGQPVLVTPGTEVILAGTVRFQVEVPT